MEDKSFTFTLSGRATTALTMILMGLEEAENQPMETRAAAAFVADELHPQLTEQVPSMIAELDEWLEKNPDLSEEDRERVEELRSGALQRYEELQMTKAAREAGISEPEFGIHVPPEKMV